MMNKTEYDLLKEGYNDLCKKTYAFLSILHPYLAKIPMPDAAVAPQLGKMIEEYGDKLNGYEDIIDSLYNKEKNNV